MAPRGAQFIGFDPPVPPFTKTWENQQLDPQDAGHVLQSWFVTVTIDYDANTGVLAATGSTQRDPGCKWRFFLTFVGQPGEHRVSIPVGAGTFNTSDLGVSTITDLNNASYSVTDH